MNGASSVLVAVISAAVTLLAGIGSLFAIPATRRRILTQSRVDEAQARQIDGSLAIAINQEARAMLTTVGENARAAEARAKDAEARADAAESRADEAAAQVTSLKREIADHLRRIEALERQLDEATEQETLTVAQLERVEDQARQLRAELRQQRPGA